MKSHGLLMTPDLIRATLAGIKTETRRIPTPRNTLFDGGTWPKELVKDGAWKTKLDWNKAYIHKQHGAIILRQNKIIRVLTPRIQPGDSIYVKEAFAANVPGCEAQGGYSYKADHRDPKGDAMPLNWKSPMFMPREAARIVRRVEIVGFEFLQDITKQGAENEGIAFSRIDLSHPVKAFGNLWDSINADRGYPWASNPPVLVIKFGKENIV